jgi:hypothetical protein
VGHPAPRKRASKQEAGPSVKLLLMPFLVFAVSACAAGLHKVLGEPLGATAAAKLADATQTLMLMLVVYGPFVGYVQRQNAALANTQERPRLGAAPEGEEGRDDDDDDDTGNPVRRRLPR